MKKSSLVPRVPVIPAIRKAIVVAVSQAVLGLTAAHAAQITVENLTDASVTDGSCSLREALNTANSDNPVDNCVQGDGADIIVFDPSLLPGTITISSSFLSVYSDLDIQGPGQDQLTISGNGSSQVFRMPNSNTVSLSGLTISDGSYFSGGGIYSGANLVIDSCVISGNTATSGEGGGIKSFGNLTISNTTISGNSAATGGGGVSTRPDAGVSSVHISNSSIHDNTSSFRGGGLYTAQGTLTVNNSSFTNNLGGGLDLNALATITDSQISGNVGDFAPGVRIASNINGAGDLTISGSTISGNEVTIGAGAGVVNYKGTLKLVNSTVSGNKTADQGPGIMNIDGNLVVRNVTVVNNTAKYDAGSLLTSGYGTVSVSNSIFANSDAQNECVSSGGPFPQNFNNLIEDGSCGGDATNLLTGDPMLGPLQDNGGPTFTHLPKPGSPVLDSGDQSRSEGPFDQRGTGFPRVFGVEVDRGAVEADLQPGILSIDPDSVTVNEQDGTAELLVTRTGGADGAVSASYDTQDGTAVAGEDFTAVVSGPVSFADGDSASKAITVTLVNDAVVEPTEQFSVVLSSPVGGASLGNDTGTITIEDDDKANVEDIFNDGFEDP